MKRVLAGTKEDVSDLSEIYALLDKIEMKLRSIKSMPIATGSSLGLLGGAGNGLGLSTGSASVSLAGNGSSSLSDMIFSNGRASLANVYNNATGGAALAGGGYLAQQFASSSLNYQTQRILNGGDDVLARNRMAGSLLGGIIGGGLGIFGGPGGIAGGIAVGSQIGGSALEWLSAGNASIQSARGALNAPVNTIRGNDYWDTKSAFGLSMRASSYAQYVNSRLPQSQQEMQMSAADFGNAESRIISGLFAGGQDPFASSGRTSDLSYQLNPNYGKKFFEVGQEIGRDPRTNRSSPGGMMNKLTQVASYSIAYEMLRPRRISGSDETVSEMYTRRLGLLYGKDAPEMAKSLSPIFGTLPETGGNIADILSKFGPESTTAFLKIQNDDLSASVDPMVLSRTSAGMRGATRSATLGSLQARGSGAAVAGAMSRRANLISSLPGGKDSVEYAQTMAGWRSADTEAFEQNRMTQFGIPKTRLQGQIDRLDAMPFSPGNRMGLELSMIAGEKSELASLTSFRKRRASSGQLSEAEEYGLVQQEEGIKTDMASRLGRLAYGQENKMAAYSAGRPNSFNRYNSLNLAAIAVKGTPVMDFGAADSGQAKDQAAWFAQLSGGSVSSTPFSRSADINGHGGEIVALLRELVSQGKSGKGGVKGRGSEATGYATAQFADKTLNQQKLWDNAN